MLSFVVPLKSKRVASSWAKVSELFERTLRSACRQTSNDFRVVVVCHEKPDIDFSHAAIDYVKVDFPVPTDIDFPMPPQSRESKETVLPLRTIDKMHVDKRRKVWLGMNHAHQLNSSYVMILDADDLVSRHLAEFVCKSPGCNGWFLQSGYFYKEGSRFIYLKKYKFNISCGSSRIIRRDLYDFTKDFRDPLAVPSKLLARNIYHGAIKLCHGERLDALPFPGAIYCVENGDNICTSSFEFLQRSRQFVSPFARVKDIFNYRFLGPSIREEYGLLQSA